MRIRVTTILAAAFLCLAPAASRADLLFYSQDFESLGQADLNALANDGWNVYGNVFDSAMVYIYGYGAFPAPNNPGAPAFCVIVSGEGGATQGLQQLSVFSDYENTLHGAGDWIESNVFQEQTVGAADVGATWYFEFDAKHGDWSTAQHNPTAAAFIKTIDSNHGYALTNFIPLDMTSIAATWNRYSLSIVIDASLVGQLLQFGFLNTATHYDPTAIFYDNVVFSQTSSVGVTPLAARASGIQLGVLGNPAVGQATQGLAFTLPHDGHATVRIYDLRGAVVATLVDRDLAAGRHQVAWSGRDDGGRAVAPGLYIARVEAGAERAVAKLSRLN
jgi:hypothetical protein